jgi:DNA replication and repair protein RecF
MKFSPGFNFILGENGVGKSNILEAITILAQLKSFRAIDDREIVRWGETSYFCSSTLTNCDHEKFEVGVQATDFLKKKFKIDGLEIKRGIDYYGKFLVVAFSPVDIEIINGSPEARRRFFDSVLSKIDKTYLINLSEFKKILTSRNKLLK